MNTLDIRKSATSIPFLYDLIDKNRDLDNKLVAFLTGSTRLLVVGGEPGNGKSLFSGGVALLHQQLRKTQTKMLPLATISYDELHFQFLRKLAEAVGRDVYVPVGETHPRAREIISQTTFAIINFALRQFPEYLILWESPLVGNRGELAYKEIARKNTFLQIIVMFSPALWRDVLHIDQRYDQLSAQKKAVLQIHRQLLAELQIEDLPREKQLEGLAYYWHVFAYAKNGVVVSWNPMDTGKQLDDYVALLKSERHSPNFNMPSKMQQYINEEYKKAIERLGLQGADRLYTDIMQYDQENYSQLVLEQQFAASGVS